MSAAAYSVAWPPPSRATAVQGSRAPALLAPYVIPPRSARPVFVQGALASPAIDAAFHSICSYEVKAGMVLVLTHVVLNFVGSGHVDGSGDMLWNLVTSKAPNSPATIAYAINGYANVPFLLGTLAGDPWPLAPTIGAGFRIDDQVTVILQVQNVSLPIGAPNYFNGVLLGFEYPMIEEER